MRVPALAVGGPYVLDVRAGTERVRAQDLLVGDVWVLSGQSNMQWTVEDSDDGAAVVAAADDTRIRHLRVPRAAADAPADDLPSGTWEPATPEFVGDFSGVGYFFARDLRQHVDVPIGLLHASWGGSRIEPWMDAQMLGLDDAGLAATLEGIRAAHQVTEAALRERLGGTFPDEATEPVDGVMPALAMPDLDDADWTTLRVPVRWESAGYDGLDGVAWYRTTFEVSAEEAALLQSEIRAVTPRTAAQAADITLRATANSNENDEDYDGLVVFKDYVEKASNGAIEVELFIGTQLCSTGAECLQGIADGSIDIYISTSGGASGIFPYVQVLDLRFAGDPAGLGVMSLRLSGSRLRNGVGI